MINMKKLLIFIGLACCLGVSSQSSVFVVEKKDTITELSNMMIISNRKVYNINTWPSEMADAYIAINGHYPTEFADSVRTFIIETFDSTNGYYQTTFGDSTTAGWFYVLKINGNLANTGGVAKTGDVPRWNVDGDVTVSLQVPAHTLGDGDGWILLSSTDGWDGVTILNLINQTNWDRYMPKFDMANNTRFNLYQGFDDIFPSMTASSVTQIRSHNYNIDSVVSIDGLLSTTNDWIWFYDCSLRRYSVDNIYKEAREYFEITPPTKNLSIRTERVTEPASQNSAPTGDSCNADIQLLDRIFTNAGHALTYIIETDGVTPTIDQLPYLTLPDTNYILVGVEYEIYDDGIAAKSIDENALNVDYVCDIGSRTTHGYLFNEEVGDVGFHDFTVFAMAGCDTIDTLEVVINLIEPLETSINSEFLLVGNSLFNAKPIIDSIRTTITGVSVDLNGTYGTPPNEQEGRSGYRYLDYISDYRVIHGGGNPFWIGGEFNFEQYRIDSLGLSLPLDFVIIQLGINSFTYNELDTAWIENTWLGYAKEFIDSVLNDGTEHVILCMPPKCVNNRIYWDALYQGLRDQDQYIRKMQYAWLRLNQIYSGKRYSDRVSVSPQGVFIDRTNNYGDHVHPNDDGYWQLTKPLRALIEGIIKEESE